MYGLFRYDLECVCMLLDHFPKVVVKRPWIIYAFSLPKHMDTCLKFCKTTFSQSAHLYKWLLESIKRPLNVFYFPKH